jgi:hypothetical protein
MVLKVVTSKIFKILELPCSPTVCSSVLGQQMAPGEKALAFGMRALPLVPGRCAHVKLPKNADYLIDNIVVINIVAIQV